LGVPARRDTGLERRPNPFGGELALSNSTYAAFRGKRLVRLPSGEPAAPRMEYVHDSFRALVSNIRFSCVGAKAALGSGSYRVGLYERLGSAGAAAGLARDLFWFVEEQGDLDGEFSTFVASFVGPTGADEETFERLLWEQLQRLHEEDRRHHRWDPSVSADPDDPRFAFSFAGIAFFVVGLHPASSRFARRFAWPTLVFNAHHQFDRLREAGGYERMQEVIRSREIGLEGDLNPNLGEFGVRSEARQYSGRPAEADWRCPFHAGGEGGAAPEKDPEE
jgi:FPC/CPF motif-containing protein YcgG